MEQQARSPLPAIRFGRERRYPALEQLICAAICNARFATLLLNDPEHALDNSDVGQRLSADERRMALAVREADDIYDYAGRLHALVTRSLSSSCPVVSHIADEYLLTLEPAS